jgi:hypothetical protein
MPALQPLPPFNGGDGGAERVDLPHATAPNASIADYLTRRPARKCETRHRRMPVAARRFA